MTLFKFAAVCLLALLAFVPAASADLAPAGECGGVHWLDDPDITTRTRVVEIGDLPILAMIVEAITEGAGEQLLEIETHDDGGGKIDCAVVFSAQPPGGPSRADALIADLLRSYRAKR